jgi:chromosome segregation ATPase
VEALRSTEVLTKQNLAQLEGILAGVVQSSATERAAAAAQIQGLRDTIGYLNDAVTSSLAGHKAGLAESAAGVNAAVNRLSTTAESVNGAIQRLLEAVHTLDQSSCLFKAKERELQELKAENAKLKAQLASNQRGSTVSSANAALPLSANAASGPTKATTQPVTSFAAGVGSSGSFFPS